MPELTQEQKGGFCGRCDEGKQDYCTKVGDTQRIANYEGEVRDGYLHHKCVVCQRPIWCERVGPGIKCEKCGQYVCWAHTAFPLGAPCEYCERCFSSMSSSKKLKFCNLLREREHFEPEAR